MYKKLLQSELNNQHLEGKAIIAFRAVWCPTCQMVGPELERLASSDEGINVFDFDVDQNIAFAGEMNVSSIPSLFYFKDGKLVNHTVGYMPAEELKNQFK